MANTLIDINKPEVEVDTPQATEEMSEAATPTQEDIDILKPDDSGVINVDMAPIKKKRFCINNDLDHMLELNVSDTYIVMRLEKALKKLEELQKSYNQEMLNGTSEDRSLEDISEIIGKIDSQMRELVDYIFDAEVSKACASDGSMYDVFNGAFRYEHIIESLMKLYEANIKVEYNKMRDKLSKHTGKYTKKR